LGIIRQQTIKGSVYSYLGAVLGFINVGILMPKLLTTDQYGLTSILVAISNLFAQFSSLGFNSVINRLFPYFRSEKEKHHGFFLLLTLVGTVGFLISLVGFFSTQSFLVDRYSEQSALLVDYIYYLPLIILATLFFGLWDNYNKALFDAVSGILFKEFFTRILIFLAVVAFGVGVVNFSGFVFLYVMALCSPAILMIATLLKRNQVSLGAEWGFIGRRFLKIIVSVAIYGLLAGMGNMAVITIDKIMVNDMLGLSSTGVYSIAFYFGTLIILPSRALKKIATTVIAEAWKRKDMVTIQKVYRETGFNQSLLAFLLFVGIWANVGNIFTFLPPEYSAGKYVILFIGLVNVLDMMAGVSSVIVLNSPKFRMQTLFLLILISCIVVSNLLFIPIWGMTGAAVASLVSVVVFHTIKYFYLLKVFGLKQFDRRYLGALGIAIVSYTANLLLPQFENFIFDIIVRSALIGTIFVGFVLLSKLVPDLNAFLKSQLAKFF
jgi:O-antigen/teichoic acid export membrane protein